MTIALSDKAEISVTIDKATGEQEVNLANVAPDYLAIVFGNAIAQVANDPYVMGQRNNKQFLLDAVALFVQHCGAEIDMSTGWNDVNIIKPRYEGPFLCYCRKENELLPDMYYDKTQQIFGNKEHVGYPGVTHWLPMPR